MLFDSFSPKHLRRYLCAPLLAAFCVSAASLSGSAATDAGAPPSLESLFEERTRAVVYVEYFIQREMERQPASAVGLVVDDEGLIVLLNGAVPDWVPPDQFKDFRVHLPNSRGDGYAAEYLGPDLLNGWCYLRLSDAEALGRVTPITAFPSAQPGIGEEVWGVCMSGGDMDYVPYLRSARLSTAQRLPLMTGFATSEVAAPGSAVFNMHGAFVGWGGGPLPLEYEMWAGGEYLRANIRKPDESHVFLFAEPFFENLGGIPETPMGAPRPWLGVAGLRPVERDTAEFLGFENRGAVVVSEVLDDTPASRAGLQDRDIILAVNGEQIPSLRLPGAETVWVEREILKQPLYSLLSLEVLRGAGELISLQISVAEAPKPVRAAEKQYFEKLGYTVREITLADALQRRIDWSERRGAVVSFVRPNSPGATASLQPGDWIQEVDGQPTRTYEEVVAALEKLLQRETLSEYVLLVRRNNETAVLRVKQN